MKVHKPADGKGCLQLIAIDKDAAGEAHYENIKSKHRANPKVDLEKGVSHPQSFRMLQPQLPRTHSLSVRFESTRDLRSKVEPRSPTFEHAGSYHDGI
jgi:hypothetical protein